MRKAIVVGSMIIVLCALYFCIRPFITIGISNIDISKEEWKEDIVFLRDTLAEKHPNLYSYISEEEYLRDFDDLLNDIDRLGSHEIMIHIQKSLAKINDPHTYIDYTIHESLPIELYYFDEGLYIIGADSEYKELIGAKIISMETNDIDSVIQMISGLSPNLNESCVKYYAAQNMINPYVLRYFDSMTGQTVQLKLQTIQGETVTKTISVKNKKDIDLVHTSDLIRERPLYLTHDDRHWYTLLDARTLYYQDNVMLPNTVGKEVIDAIQENDIDTLVIDLRKNTGGMYVNQQKFVKTISKLQNENKFKIYILTGRATFSSAILYIHDFIDHANCILAGEPPRTGYNHYGDQRSFRLPHSKINIKYASKYLKIHDRCFDEITPDIVIENHFNAYAEGIDPVLEYVTINEP